jgi:hypothetical protein
LPSRSNPVNAAMLSPLAAVVAVAKLVISRIEPY